jgi:L-aspartate oxidase
MAYRAGAALKDLEFIQFHPTSLAAKGAKNFLISEAVRGEGARLVNSAGEYFMQRYDACGELASRDIVAKAIYAELRKGPAYLDIRHKGKEFLKLRFPTIYARLLKFGIDMSKDLIPVSPAAHYLCGGINVNLRGETSVKNLFAFGECACTGVHGGNRLASNSLLEAAVFSAQIADVCKMLVDRKVEAFQLQELRPAKISTGRYKKKIKDVMWNCVGIVRNEKNLKSAVKELDKIEQTLKEELKSGVNASALEALNLAQAGALIARAALERKDSLGCHFRED